VAGTSQIVAADQGMISGAVVVTPIQHWLLEQNLTDLHHWNQAVMLETATEIDIEAMRRAVKVLLEHHDALRLRVRQEAGGYIQEIAEREEAEVVSFVELEEGADVEEAASRVQGRLDLERGPVVRVEVMKLKGESGWRVLIVIHHLAVDGVSWRIVLEDLVKVYESEKEGRQARLEAKTTSYKEWARRLERYAESEEVKKEVGYWEGLGRREVERLRVDGEAEGEGNEVKNARRVNREMSEEETRKLLREVNGTYKTQMNEVILSGLAEGVRRWSGQGRVTVEVEGHGREQEVVAGVDLTRTVGWFTTKYPLFLEASLSGDISETIKRVKERAREVPSGGMGYGVLKYLSKDEEVRRVMESVPEAEISFNYLGQLDSAVEMRSGFKPANESVGRSRSSLGKRKYLLEMIAGVVGGRLQVGVIYSEKIHKRETIEALATHYVDSLRSIIEHCLSPEAGGYTPSDFPKANFNQKELDELIEELTEATGD
jgi:non-ribosomal peptide synthase protein (TIGR01720 family)